MENVDRCFVVVRADGRNPTGVEWLGTYRLWEEAKAVAEDLRGSRVTILAVASRSLDTREV